MTIDEIDRKIAECQMELANLTAERKRMRIESANADNTLRLKALKVLLKSYMGKAEYEQLMRTAEELANDYSV